MNDMAIRKVGSGTKEWANRIAKRARECGFVPTIKKSKPNAYGTPLYTVYARQNKKAKVHDYIKLFT